MMSFSEIALARLKYPSLFCSVPTTFTLFAVAYFHICILYSMECVRCLQSDGYTVKNWVSSEHQGVTFLCGMQTPKCSHNTSMSR